MKILFIGTGVAVLSAMIVTDVSAMPFLAPDGAAPSQALIRVGNGYGPVPYGLYGHRRRRHRSLSYGTGYHGRGTRTGGPAGGLPGRS